MAFTCSTQPEDLKEPKIVLHVLRDHLQGSARPERAGRRRKVKVCYTILTVNQLEDEAILAEPFMYKYLFLESVE